jgi:peptide chain release factor 2
MVEYKKELESLLEQIERGIESVDLDKLKNEKDKLSKQMLEPSFWDNPEDAAEVSTEVAHLEKNIEGWEKVLEDCKYLLELVEELDFEKPSSEEHEEFENYYAKVFKDFKKLNIANFLSGKFDKKNAVLSVICGMGGDDAQDFTAMLGRMYVKYAESEGYKVEILEENKTDSGLKNISMKISGPFAFGFLKYEHGLHRLVRLSPFNSGNTRETSFAMVDVLPELHLSDHVEIDESDLRVDTFRASGAGGQHVNTTDSAVRITHIPTGVVASSQTERSQHQNKENAMSLLQSKLVTMMHDKNMETLEGLRGDKNDMSFGHQIRSYVLHPYKMVKDHRTDYSESNPEAVFEGKLQGFIEAEVEGGV